ncbi:MAG: cytochrome c family protein [Desulfobacterota bacterium]|nr:cytochrome c family protein [Thermodesulfobacteriota bacterium]
MKHAAHILRLVVVLILVGVIFFAVRSIMVPEDFGTQGSYSYGYFRAASEQEQKELVPVFRGSEKCKGCHDAQYNTWAQGKHYSVACETCHGSWHAHNNNTKDAMIKDNSPDACMLCHASVAGRPATFPQIDSIDDHIARKGGDPKEGQRCSACHNPHNPL